MKHGVGALETGLQPGSAILLSSPSQRQESAMTPTQVRLVQSSFALVAPIAPQAAGLFYAHLFEADPSLRHLFKGDMAAQGDRLMQMIGAAVGLLSQPERLMPVLRQLGARHQGYGVVSAHYDTVGAALLKTLSQGLGEAFTPEVREAWAAMYQVVAQTMQEAAVDAVAA
jgi:hemoglobin-like flavoprotein